MNNHGPINGIVVICISQGGAIKSSFQSERKFSFVTKDVEKLITAAEELSLGEYRYYFNVFILSLKHVGYQGPTRTSFQLRITRLVLWMITKNSMNLKLPTRATEYLPCMLHVNSPIGILPRYSSWSLVCLGPSSLYSHNAGLSDQPGFLTGSAFLLPWDVTVRVQHAETMANEGRRPYAGYFDAFYTCLATVAISNVHSDAGTLERENAPKTIIRNLQSRFLSASNTSVHEGTDLSAVFLAEYLRLQERV